MALRSSSFAAVAILYLRPGLTHRRPPDKGLHGIGCVAQEARRHWPENDSALVRYGARRKDDSRVEAPAQYSAPRAPRRPDLASPINASEVLKLPVVSLRYPAMPTGLAATDKRPGAVSQNVPRKTKIPTVQPQSAPSVAVASANQRTANRDTDEIAHPKSNNGS